MRKPKKEILAYRAKLGRVEPWSLAKMVFLVGAVLSAIFLGAVALAWLAIDMIGVWDKINSTIASVVGDSTAFSIQKYLSLENSLIIAGLFSVVNLLVFTFVSIVAAYVFNAFATLAGGVRVEMWNSPATEAEDVLRAEVAKEAPPVENTVEVEGSPRVEQPDGAAITLPKVSGRRVARYEDARYEDPKA